MTYSGDFDSDKLQTRPLVREGALHRQIRRCQRVIKSGHDPQMGLDTKTDWLTVGRNTTLIPTYTIQS
jgi:hypothetical protein